MGFARLTHATSRRQALYINPDNVVALETLANGHTMIYTTVASGGGVFQMPVMEDIETTTSMLEQAQRR